VPTVNMCLRSVVTESAGKGKPPVTSMYSMTPKLCKHVTDTYAAYAYPCVRLAAVVFMRQM
jgi:hypothetical protein